MFQKLCQLCKPGVYFLFAAAGLKVEIHTAAGTKTLAILGTEKFCVHRKDKRRTGEVTQIHFIVFQQYDILVIVKLAFLCENTRVISRFLLGEFFHTAVTGAVERCVHLHITQEHTRFVPDPTFHIDRTGHGLVGTEFQIGKIHEKLEILLGIRCMQQLVDVQTHNPPRNDTGSIIG